MQSFATKTGQMWDDKFGLISDNSYKCGGLDTVKVEGVGTDAEIITNKAGGKQSKSPMAMHLVDPRFLEKFASNKAEELGYIDEGGGTTCDNDDIPNYTAYRAIEYIAMFMQDEDEWYLLQALDYLECEEIQQVMTIAKVLQYGADRYEPNNWRLIPQEEHINHALVHLMAEIAGDKQDNHRDHALCRLMMAYATKKSENFDYCNYVKKSS